MDRGRGSFWHPELDLHLNLHAYEEKSRGPATSSLPLPLFYSYPLASSPPLMLCLAAPAPSSPPPVPPPTPSTSSRRYLHYLSRSCRFHSSLKVTTPNRSQTHFNKSMNISRNTHARVLNPKRSSFSSSFFFLLSLRGALFCYVDRTHLS